MPPIIKLVDDDRIIVTPEGLDSGMFVLSKNGSTVILKTTPRPGYKVSTFFQRGGLFARNRTRVVVELVPDTDN